MTDILHPDRQFDVVIIGGGVIGSAIAYFLTASSAWQGTLAVIERDPTYAASSSSLSASGVRQQFGTRPNIQASRFGIEFLRTAETLLSVPGETSVDIGLRERGYLLLGGPQQVEAFHAKQVTQHACGVATALLDQTALQARYPWLDTQGIAIGSLGLDGEGWFDGPALLQAFRRKARSLGATYISGEVAAIERAGPRIAAVRLANGEPIGCGTLVNAAGPWARHVAAMAGIELQVVPRKRCVFVLDCPAEFRDMPFVIEPAAFYVRPEGRYYITGTAPDVENAPDDFSLDVDHALFDERIWPALAKRIPAFEQLRLLRAWAGHYEYNVFDHSAVIGRCPGLENLIFANGFSGHGMMHSPAAGKGVSELILHGAYRTIDLCPFAFERIASGAPIAEDVY